MPSSTRKLVVGAVAVVALAGIGAAVAAADGNGPSLAPTAPPAAFAATRGARPDHHGRADDFAVAASYLGLTTAQLQTQLQSGKTLAQIADAATGKSAKGLIAALVAAEKKELAGAVSAGRLTQAQANAIEANLEQRFTDFVNGTRGAHAGCGDPGGVYGRRGSNGSYGFRLTPRAPAGASA
jgi:hypothetical protein